MTIKELTPEQLEQVKQNYYMMQQAEKGEGVSYGELADINNLVTDAEIFEAYANTIFSPDDFGLTGGADHE